MDAVRITISPRIEAALKPLRKKYPTLSDAEIFKLSLAELNSKLLDWDDESPEFVSRLAAWSMNLDGSLDDPSEDIYTLQDGKSVDFR